MTLRIIKAYQVLVTRCRTGVELPYDADRAVAEYRAFFVKATDMNARVEDEFAKNVMREVLETLRQDLDK